MTEIEKLVKLARREYYACDEDCWYSCPKSGQCCNENAADSCNCGADEHNAQVAKIAQKLGIQT